MRHTSLDVTLKNGEHLRKLSHN